MQVKLSSRARSVRLTVKAGGEVVATLPRGMSAEVLRAFVARKAGWLARAVARMKKVTPTVPLPRGHYKKHRGEAERFIRRRVQELSQLHGLSYRRVTVRNQKTRWGSCSRTGNLSFNYKLLLLPPALADYVILHELCHRVEFNHSKKFWQLMERVLPEARELRRQLKAHGHGIVLS